MPAISSRILRLHPAARHGNSIDPDLLAEEAVN
jgi:hypothetical protein